VYRVNKPLQRLWLLWFEHDDGFAQGTMALSAETKLKVRIDFDDDTYTVRENTNV